MNVLQQSLQKLLGVSKNSMSLAKEFFRYGGSRSVLPPSWAEVQVADQDFYTGYLYAAIKRRANAAARLASEIIEIESKLDTFEHPYWSAITASPYFSSYQFFSQVSTYLDLEGVYYLFLMRGSNDDMSVVGDIQFAKLLNPYTISRKLDSDMNVIAYEQNENGRVRLFPPYMILPFHQLSPFDWSKNYGMTDANRGPQFSLKTSQNFTNQTLSKAKNTPYIISTDEIVDEQVKENIIARIKGHDIGEPIFTNGGGALTVSSMPTNLKEAMLKDVNDGSRDELFSVAGLSKTMMGIEQSGTTRETAKIQKDLFIEMEILPILQLIVDTINLDYRKYYPTEFERSNGLIKVTNPTATDHDAEIKEVEVKQKKADILESLIENGYDEVDAAAYVEGKIPLDQLKKKEQTLATGQQDQETVKKHTHDICGDDCQHHIVHSVSPGTASLQNAITQLESKIVFGMAHRLVSKMEKTNAIEGLEEFDDFALLNLITQKEERSYKKELAAILVAFYLLSIAGFGQSKADERESETGYSTTFDPSTKAILDQVRQIATAVGASHVDTVVSDIYREAYNLVQSGGSQQEIISGLTSKYNDITQTRARLIAQTEARRAQNMAQYTADQQMIAQNGLEGRVVKSWHTQSMNPCPFCTALESMGEIPFDEPWLDYGETITIGGKSFTASLESIEAGLLHPHCLCYYEIRVLPN